VVVVINRFARPKVNCLADHIMLARLLSYLSFQDWRELFTVSKEIRTMLSGSRFLREEVLERFFGTGV
jgi:hypothetical protein